MLNERVRLLQLEQLKYFKCLAEHKSITEASKSLYISQQALSSSVRNLEKELKVELFKRTSKGVTLTLDGEYLLAEVMKIFNDLEKIKLHFLNKDKHITMNIGSITITRKFLLSKSISYFYKNFPQIKLNVYDDATVDIINGVLAGRYDLGYISTLSINKEEYTVLPAGLTFTPLKFLPFFIEMHKDYPLKKYKRISISELVRYPVIVLDVDHTDSYLPKKIIEILGIKQVILADNEVLYTQLLEDGLGYALMTDFNIDTVNDYSSQQLIQRPLEDDILAIVGSVKKMDAGDKEFYIDLFNSHI